MIAHTEMKYTGESDARKILRLQARLDAAEKVCEAASLEYGEYCNNNECTVCKALDNWRKVKDG